jgi:DNA mismatch endonuclease (patch repair protein)
MPDPFSPDERSRIMGRVKQSGTRPEMLVEQVLNKLGFLYQLQGKNLPGKPDFVFPGLKKIIFVHGCFWHGHPGCKRASRPSSNQEFWDAKLTRNIERDRETLAHLKQLGWTTLVVWECEIKKTDILKDILLGFLNAGRLGR